MIDTIKNAEELQSKLQTTIKSSNITSKSVRLITLIKLGIINKIFKEDK